MGEGAGFLLIASPRSVHRPVRDDNFDRDVAQALAPFTRLQVTCFDQPFRANRPISERVGTLVGSCTQL